MSITTSEKITSIASTALAACGHHTTGEASAETRTPITGTALPPVHHRGISAAEAAAAAQAAYLQWRAVPAPSRGETVRTLGSLLRTHKEHLADLIQVEVGKIRSEALGEVQEMIDICDFAVGLSRQLYGLTITSERPQHRLTETWQPIGPVAVITAFNFPAAVWAWNAALSLVCGNPVIWKPSELTPMTSLAVQALADQAASLTGAPEHLTQLVLGGRESGEALAADPKVALVSATGSTRMGREVAGIVGQRFGRSLLELGGNNATIITPSADLDMAIRAVTFGAAGTAGQRCTTLRRLIVHEAVKTEMLDRLERAYATLSVGDPLDGDTLVGPLINLPAAQRMQDAMGQAVRDGGSVLVGGDRLNANILPDSAYMRPAVVLMPGQTASMRTETFAPLLYVLSYTDIDEAIRLNNDVPQGLSSSIFTRDLREAEIFCGPTGSDCGIANVNMGPSGAEIGGAFGGEKETGGGRESGSDAWKAYMRRSTSTVNYSDQLPLAQGVVFG